MFINNRIWRHSLLEPNDKIVEKTRYKSYLN